MGLCGNSSVQQHSNESKISYMSFIDKKNMNLKHAVKKKQKTKK